MNIRGHQVLVHSGRYVSLINPDPATIEIEDIAHALSNLCRYTGHVRDFYSVAQHSVGVSKIVPRQDMLAGLMHDATEAFVGDVARPLKDMLPEYKTIERGIWKAIAKRFDMSPELPESVHHADLVMLATERRDLMPPNGDWDILKNVDPLSTFIVCVDPPSARSWFLKRWAQLRGIA